MIKLKRDFFKRHTFWVMIVIGFVYLALGIHFKPSYWGNFFLYSGQAILASGAFAAIVQSWQYTGLFKEELEKIIYSDEFLSTKNNLTDIWCKVTNAACKASFPDLSESLHSTIINEYLPTDKNFYYKNYNFSSTVDWADRKNLMMCVREQTKVTLTPVNENETIHQNYKFRIVKNENNRNSELTLRKLTKNGVSVAEDISDFLKKDEITIDNVVYIQYSYELELKGETSYTIERILDKKFNVIEEPLAKYSVLTLLQGSDVKVNVRPDDIIVKFMSLGTTKDFINSGMDPNFDPHKDKVINKTFDGILFPSQGFILHYGYDPNRFKENQLP